MQKTEKVGEDDATSAESGGASRPEIEAEETKKSSPEAVSEKPPKVEQLPKGRAQAATDIRNQVPKWKKLFFTFRPYALTKIS